MEKETATLIAAILAAATSATGILLNIRSVRNSDLRLAHRNTLEPHVERLGQALHQILASSNVYIDRASNGMNLETWSSRATEASEILKEIRWKVRYPLWGIDEGLRTLSRLFDWMTHLRDHPNEATELLRSGDELRKTLDRVILSSYLKGKPPTFIERKLISYRVWKVIKKREEIKQKVVN